MVVESQYIDLIDRNRELIAEGSCQPMNAVRDESIAKFANSSIPTQRDERYRHTDISAQYAANYGVNLKRITEKNIVETFKCRIDSFVKAIAYHIGDVPYVPQNAELDALGVVVSTIKELAISNPQLIERYYGKLSQKSDEATVSLNTSLAQDGIVIYIPKGVKVAEPIHIVNLVRTDIPQMLNRRVLIVAEDNSEATVLVCDHNFSKAETLSTRVTEIFVEQGAQLQYHEVEETTPSNTTITNLFATQKSDSTLDLSAITLYNGVTRNNAEVYLTELNATVNISGIGIADDTQKIDTYTTIHHIAPHCNSDEQFKQIADGDSKISFLGRIVVDEGASKTEAKQNCKNILLSSTSQIFSEPQLEIYTDDVKCAHGSTIGQLDETALFYLQQRGIPKESARMMLMLAFTADVVSRVKYQPLHDRLQHQIEQRLMRKRKECNCN